MRYGVGFAGGTNVFERRWIAKKAISEWMERRMWAIRRGVHKAWTARGINGRQKDCRRHWTVLESRGQALYALYNSLLIMIITNIDQFMLFPIISNQEKRFWLEGKKFSLDDWFGGRKIFYGATGKGAKKLKLSKVDSINLLVLLQLREKRENGKVEGKKGEKSKKERKKKGEISYISDPFLSSKIDIHQYLH